MVEYFGDRAGLNLLETHAFLWQVAAVSFPLLWLPTYHHIGGMMVPNAATSVNHQILIF